MQDLVQTEHHGPWCFSRELSRSVNLKPKFGSYWKLHQIRFMEGFTSSVRSELVSRMVVQTMTPFTEAETGGREEAVNREDEEEITDDDTMVMYVNAQEPNHAMRPQLIACYRSMWTVNWSKEFFDNGIMNKTGAFRNRAIMPESRVVLADIKAYSDIYRKFQLHQFNFMDNAPGESSSHLTREFYSSYAATLMNFVADTETTKRGQKYMVITWGPLNSIINRGKSIDISKASINRMLYSPEYSAPASVGPFEGKHYEVTSDAMMEDTKVLTTRKEIKDEMRTELSVLKNRIDGLENLVPDRFQAAGSADIEEFRAQLVEMRTHIAKLTGKPVQVPTLVMPDSLMQMLNQAPSTQSIDDLWGEPPTSKFGNRKHKAGELYEETPTDPARVAKRQEKKARRASKREAREKEAFEQQQRDAALVGASGSGAPAPTNEDQIDHVPSSESAPIDKGTDVHPTTGV
uniref:Integrase core domain containing protein n=1 Tax=Solanum tuberosum TaxID=4113 RepID=M1DVF2_SOLTU